MPFVKREHRNPVLIRKLPTGGYRVSTPSGIKSFRTSYRKAHAQRRILEQAEHGNPDKGMAPATYAFTYKEMTIGKRFFPETHFYNLTEDIPGHVKGSTVSDRTLLGYGYQLPHSPHTHMNDPDVAADEPVHAKVAVDDILAKAPPIYKLNYLVYQGATGHPIRLTPAMPVQMFPAGGYTNVNFKHWGFDTYDVHISFPPLLRLTVALESLEVIEVNYQIIVLGQDGGPGISAHYNHRFRKPVCIGVNGLYAYHRMFRFYRELEHLPKLPRDWQYMQFIG